MKVKVNQDVCIGCGACQAVAPDVFKMTDDGVAQEIEEQVNEQFEEDAKDALEGCPVSAIYDPQEELEEAA